MDVTRYIIENRVTGVQQNVGKAELDTIQGNQRVGKQWFVKETLPGAITKNIPPANVKVNNEELKPVKNAEKNK